MALLAGLGAGGVRGSLMRIEHDFYRPKVVMSPVARFGLLAVALVVAAATAVEILGARAVPALEPARYGAALVAMVCAAAMQGRAVALGGPAQPLLRPPQGREGRRRPRHVATAASGAGPGLSPARPPLKWSIRVGAGPRADRQKGLAAVSVNRYFRTELRKWETPGP